MRFVPETAQIMTLKMNKIHKTIVVMLCVVAVVILYKLNYLRYFHMAGDSAGYVDLLKRIYTFGDMKSKVFAAAYPLFDMAKTAEIFCNSELLNKYENSSFFQWHSYGIAYLIVWIGRLFTTDYVAIAAAVNAINIVIIFLGAYLICNKNKFNPLEVMAFAAIMLSFIPLIGMLSGQYYFDRLFISLSILYIYFNINEDNKSWIASLGVLVIAASVSERSALMIGVIAGYLAVFDEKRPIKKRLFTIIMAMLVIGYYVVWSKLVQDSIYAGSLSKDIIISNLSQIFDSSSNLSKLTKELLLYLLPLSILAIFNIKYFVLFVLLFLPNILVTVGGAEKTGFVTHYHSYYLPMLIIASFMGYRQIKTLIELKYACYAILAIIIGAQVYLIKNQIFVVSPTLSHSFAKDFELFNSSSILSNADVTRKEQLKRLISNIKDPSVSISVNEFVMPTLVAANFTNIRIFPIGLGDSSYIILETAVGSPNEEIILPIYGDIKELKMISKCMSQRAEKIYTEIAKENIGATTFRLIKRNN